MPNSAMAAFLRRAARFGDSVMTVLGGGGRFYYGMA
jgi:hypothetical protein